MTKTLKLSWTRFGFCLAVLGIFPAFLIISDVNSRDSWTASAAVCLLSLSLVGFFSLGWVRLRRANAIQPILATDTDRIRRLLIGPVGLALAWLIGTVLVLGAFAVASAIFWHAA